ncbi:glycosyltransferase family 2 protein [Salinimicrobium sp. TH3]|uniref:glycosyltransferase family 2 protein n=1 Tax=Salinimicrobium sp. TH3 TaxID=2997342 RepID=UPI00227455F2|nr:glycosyltransferase family 2 protein [Salinimicrobium sp. TH3]MCY2687797.1 glycosyltransferase family 2 protein [Salinimicrobium sp. TH3]
MQNNLTIAICAYNSANVIEETLACVLKQTFQEFDLLIINDCSSDNTFNVVQDFLKKNKRQFKLINLEENKGIANARQLALIEAKTKYLLFIDSDDLPHPSLVKKQYEMIISDKNIIAVSSWLRYIDEKGDKLKGGFFIGSRTKEEFDSLARREKLIFLPIQTLFNREIALQVGGFRLDNFPIGKPRYRDFCEDLDLWTRMSDLYKDGKYIITIPEVLYYYRKGNEGVSSNAVAMSLKMKFIKKNLKLRRAGFNEIYFNDFIETVTAAEIDQLHKNARAGYFLRNGFFLLKDKKFIKGTYYLSKSIFMNPEQFMQKLKANSGLLK